MKDNLGQNIIVLPFVNTSPDNTFLFKFSGKTEEFGFTFAIFDDGTDRSDGTYTSTVITVQQQINYLKNVIFGEDYDVDWTFINERYAPAPGYHVCIKSMVFDNPAGYVSIATCSMVLQRGRIGAL